MIGIFIDPPGSYTQGKFLRHLHILIKKQSGDTKLAYKIVLDADMAERIPVLYIMEEMKKMIILHLHKR